MNDKIHPMRWVFVGFRYWNINAASFVAAAHSCSDFGSFVLFQAVSEFLRFLCRLLSALTSCLDTLLLLQMQYGFQEMLLRCQGENITNDSGSVVLVLFAIRRREIINLI